MSSMVNMRKDGYRLVDMSFYDELEAHGLVSNQILIALVTRNICCIVSFLIDGEHVLEEIKEKYMLVKDEEKHEHDLYMCENHLIPSATCRQLISIIPELTKKYKDMIRWVRLSPQHHGGVLRGVNTEHNYPAATITVAVRTVATTNRRRHSLGQHDESPPTLGSSRRMCNLGHRDERPRTLVWVSSHLEPSDGGDSSRRPRLLRRRDEPIGDDSLGLRDEPSPQLGSSRPAATRLVAVATQVWSP